MNEQKKDYVKNTDPTTLAKETLMIDKHLIGQSDKITTGFEINTVASTSGGGWKYDM